ncbi:MAG: hypothetical protein JRF72_03505, partial [Deltaproteobacteria bacterium]|nr:hypothetical protein [Deltaproteobacteria bacterium]
TRTKGFGGSENIERGDFVLRKYLRVFFNNVSDLTPQKPFKVRFRRGRSGVNLAVLETFEPPNGNSRRSMGLAGGVRRFSHRNHAITNRFHQLFDLLRIGLTQYFFAKTHGIILKRTVTTLFLNPAEC